MTRHLQWDGAVNVRDLGGLPAAGGATTRRGAIVRAGELNGLTAGGWAALGAHGIRTIVDLRNQDELRPDRARRPAALTTIHLPLDGVDDAEFWQRWGTGPQFGTPLYYGPHLERMPQRSVAVVRAIAHAAPGGVLFHCRGGRDRTGQVAMLVLDLLGVPAEVIADDYGLTAPTDETPALEAYLERESTSAREVIAATLRDARRRLRAGGLTDADVAALRARAL
jgi:protein tyrosine/serine phosphatase